MVGGGYTGLWTALLAKHADPDLDVLLLEAETIGWAASGRSGGFCSASLTHGAANGRDRFAAEFETLQRLGAENLAGLRADLDRHGIDCNLEPSGELTVATEPHQVAWLREAAVRRPGLRLRPRHGAGSPAGDVPAAGAALRGDLPAAGRDGLQPRLG
ncbi:MAG: FAD-dependent oxidoreductase, partial [Nocardioidaceae bacterium]